MPGDTGMASYSMPDNGIMVRVLIVRRIDGSALERGNRQL